MLYGNWSLLESFTNEISDWKFTVFAKCFLVLHIKATARSDVKCFADLGSALTQKRLADWKRVPVRGRRVRGEDTVQGGEQCTFISVSSSDELCNRPCEHWKWRLWASTGGCRACP